MNGKASRLPIYTGNGSPYSYNPPMTRRFSSSDLPPISSNLCATSLPKLFPLNHCNDFGCQRNRHSSSSSALSSPSHYPKLIKCSHHESPNLSSTLLPVQFQPCSLHIQQFKNQTLSQIRGKTICQSAPASSPGSPRTSLPRIHKNVQPSLESTLPKSAALSSKRSIRKETSSSGFSSQQPSKGSTVLESSLCQERRNSARFTLSQVQHNLKKGEIIEGVLRVHSKCQDLCLRNPMLTGNQTRASRFNCSQPRENRWL